jgi:signal transduction histidine kinase
MTGRAGARLAWGLAVLGPLLMSVAVLLSAVTQTDISLTGIFIWALGLAFAAVGALIASRHKDNAIGWLFLGAAITAGLSSLAGWYARYWLSGGQGPDALGKAAAWYGQLSWIPFILVPATFLVLLFPDGHLLSGRWRPVAWFAAAGIATAFVTEGLLPGPLSDYPQLDNPYGVKSPVLVPLDGLALLVLLVAILGSSASLILRFRRATGEQREQIKWLAFAAAVAGVTIPSATAGYDVLGEHAADAIIMLSVLGLPMAAGIAIQRYRLYDIDIVINKTMVFIVLAGFITAVYAGVVVGLGRLLPIGTGNLGLAIAATALVAVAFEPVRARVQHWANRLVYGPRATPYEALAAMTARVGDTADAGAALAEAAHLLAQGTGAARAVIWVTEEGRLTPRASAGDGGGAPAPVPLRGSELPELVGTDLVQGVVQDGQLVGALSLTKRPGEGVSTADRKLVEELAGQAALLLANTRLRSHLRDRLTELRVSRQRMLVAQDRARRALERDLHDGAQQELVALKVRLGLARTIATREGAIEVAAELAETAAVADEAVEMLREVARGIYPPLLESEGLSAALSALARRAELGVTVLDRGTTRYPREIEATAYFCAVEALGNAVAHAQAQHAHIELDGTDASVAVTISDDGAGFDPDSTVRGAGLTYMNDRADAAGGTLTVDSRPGHGTIVTLTLPAEAPVGSGV